MENMKMEKENLRKLKPNEKVSITIAVTENGKVTNAGPYEACVVLGMNNRKGGGRSV